MDKFWDDKDLKWKGSNVKFKSTENDKVVAYEDRFNLKTGEFDSCGEAYRQIIYMIDDEVDRYY